MKLELSEEQQLLQKSVREFAAAEIKPIARENDETGKFPRAAFAKAAELGLTGVAIPEEYGGAGMDHISYTIVIEEISRVLRVDGRDFVGAEFAVLRSGLPLRNGRAEEAAADAVRARREDRMLRAHRAAGRFKRGCACDQGRAARAISTW